MNQKLDKASIAGDFAMAESEKVEVKPTMYYLMSRDSRTRN